MGKTTITVGEWRFVRIDSLNWQVQRLREIKANGRTERAGEVDWAALPAYFGRLVEAVEWARDRIMDERGDVSDTEAFAKELRRADSEFLCGLKAAFAEASKHDLTEVER